MLTAVSLTAHSATAGLEITNFLSVPMLVLSGIALFAFFMLAIYTAHSLRRARNQLNDSERQLAWALSGSGDSLWDWNIQTGTVVRKGFHSLLGYDESEVTGTLAHLIEMMHPEDCEEVLRSIAHHFFEDTDHFENEYRILDSKGQWRWLLDRGKIVRRDKKGKPIRAAGIQTDITERKHAEQNLRLSAQVIQSMNEVVVLTDDQLKVCLVNAAFSELMNLQEDEVIGKPLHQFFSGRHTRVFYDQLLSTVNQEKYWQGELWQKTANNQEILTNTEIKALQQPNQSNEYFVVIFSDITARKRSEDRLSFLANYDTLTSLPNRGLFQQRLIESIQTENKGFGLLCVDVDHFKHINDSLGHGIGDQLLQRVAIKLKQLIPNNRTTVARLAGDEFVLLIPEMVQRSQLEHFAQSLIEAFKEAIVIRNHEVNISPSIGIARFPQDGADAFALLKNTESALHFAKSKGRGIFEFFDENIQTQTLRKLAVGNQLRKALERNELELVYQPKLDLIHDRIIGMEALLRWHNKDIGAIGPEEFIAVAEETGQVNEIGKWVLEQACEQAKKWQLRNFNIPISVNISARQFQTDSLFQRVSSILQQTELPPELLELEITETMLLEDPDTAIETLSQLRNMGVRISVDDFGTGYSSLSYLKKLPIDALKIDKAFIQDLAQDKNDEAITHAIISLAKNLKLNVIAEGVENDQQLYFLKNAGCQQVQGFLISQPMSAQATTIYCDENLH
ncbi:putative bifunctional diguanylate cyclase/phosphodiesterase [Pleionea sediminis]|uniref:putative bifunctional diguanylate cyclase/phosphodiesterase n=1 Tax=Pleionea sediminis TaxID=2569479 RepID=UPI001184B918|nr:GGDEF domain-containing phosphodiesterase [Pleionea sediminis]